MSTFLSLLFGTMAGFFVCAATQLPAGKALIASCAAGFYAAGAMVCIAEMITDALKSSRSEWKP